MYILEADYVAEILDPTTLAPVRAGDIGELIVTNLGRLGSPLVRYRTGDLVREGPADPRIPFRWLEGGVLGRRDDMVPLRGNNFYPSSLEAVLRRFAEVVEYRVEIDTTSPLAEPSSVEVEPTPTADASLDGAIGSHDPRRAPVPGRGDARAGRVVAALRDEGVARGEEVRQNHENPTRSEKRLLDMIARGGTVSTSAPILSRSFPPLAISG